MPDGTSSKDILSSPDTQTHIPNSLAVVGLAESNLQLIHTGYTVTPPDRELTPFEKVNLGLITGYIQGHLATDDFEDEYSPQSGSQREGWMESQSEEVRQYLLENRIRRQKIGFLATALMEFMSESKQSYHQFRVSDELSQKIIDLYSYFVVYNGDNPDQSGSPSGYPDKKYFELTVDEKLQLVEQADSIALDFLRQNDFQITQNTESVMLIETLDLGFDVTAPESTQTTNEDNTVIGFITKYLQGSLEPDYFSDHRNQRVPNLLRIKQISSSIYDRLKNCRLTRGAIHYAYSSFELLLSKDYSNEFSLQISEELADSIRKLNQYMRDIKERVKSGPFVTDSADTGYDSLSIKEKIDLVRQYDQLCIQLLQQNGYTVTPRSPPPPSS